MDLEYLLLIFEPKEPVNNSKRVVKNENLLPMFQSITTHSKGTKCAK